MGGRNVRQRVRIAYRLRDARAREGERTAGAPATSRRTRQQDEQRAGEVNVAREHPAADTPCALFAGHSVRPSAILTLSRPSRAAKLSPHFTFPQATVH